MWVMNMGHSGNLFELKDGSGKMTLHPRAT